MNNAEGRYIGYMHDMQIAHVSLRTKNLVGQQRAFQKAYKILAQEERKILNEADYAVASVIALAGIPLEIQQNNRPIELELYERAKLFHPRYEEISEKWSNLYCRYLKKYNIRINDHSIGERIRLEAYGSS